MRETVRHGQADQLGDHLARRLSEEPLQQNFAEIWLTLDLLAECRFGNGVEHLHYRIKV
jgi:hypothetical protein